MAGAPLVCLATTYTFHAALFEGDLLPRFLGMKFDSTEGERAFHVEREQGLATTKVCVLVDQEHVDPSQVTLRWDQLAVSVPGGAQHAKLTFLAWERCVRLIIGSANLTRTGYRRNREVAAYLDFFDDPSSNPRRVAIDALNFLASMRPWVHGTAGAMSRFGEALRALRAQLQDWSHIPDDFGPREWPRAQLVVGLPSWRGLAHRSVMDTVLNLWGDQKAHEIVVMTPFVGDLTGEQDPVIDRLLQVPRSRGAFGRLVVPGTPSQQDPEAMLVSLPRRFRDAWTQAWAASPEELHIHPIPLCREDDRMARDLHAKGLLLEGQRTSLLMIGSSNFSPHGMGIGRANIEANLCFLDRVNSSIDGLHLRDRLLEGWEEDEVDITIWPDEVTPPEDEAAGVVARLPAVFLWAAMNQRLATVTLGLDPKEPLPLEWSIRHPGEGAKALPSLVSNAQLQAVPTTGRHVVQLPELFQSVAISCLAVLWTEEGNPKTALLPVQVEQSDDLLPPEEFRGMTADAIIACLLSGCDPAEWIDRQERRNGRSVPDVLAQVDTSGYALYRVRHLGRALATLGERLLHTTRTKDALAYRLRQDPLGPCLLAEALSRECKAGDEASRAVLRFSLAEVCLTIAHVGQRIARERQESEPDLCPLFHEAIGCIEEIAERTGTNSGALGTNLEQYLTEVKRQCLDLVGIATGESHAC